MSILMCFKLNAFMLLSRYPGLSLRHYRSVATPRSGQGDRKGWTSGFWGGLEERFRRVAADPYQ